MVSTIKEWFMSLHITLNLGFKEVEVYGKEVVAARARKQKPLTEKTRQNFIHKFVTYLLISRTKAILSSKCNDKWCRIELNYDLR